MRTCKVCSIEKELTEFRIVNNKNKSYQLYKCRECERLESLERNKKIKERDPDYWRRKHLKRSFNISLDEYNLMLEKQEGRCAICKTDDPHVDTKSGFHFAVDHCHTTGKVRGLLCAHCNTGLGKFRDDVANLQQAINYLNTYKA